MNETDFFSPQMPALFKEYHLSLSCGHVPHQIKTFHLPVHWPAEALTPHIRDICLLFASSRDRIASYAGAF